ncbi:MAG: enoyl-CoA hydratase [Caulobacteraceae bacterium]
MSGPRLVYEKDGAVARIVFDNPTAHNALTRRMWSDLRDACRDVAADRAVRVLTFRGAGGKAFVSGADISGFAGFTSGQDGVLYERHIDECMAAVDAVPVPTLAIVEGWAVGGGLNIASACDFRIATPSAKFGSPIGRTIANCLSMSSCARIAGAIGVQTSKRMLLLGEMIGAQELLDSGFMLKLVEPAGLDAAVAAFCEQARGNAPLTSWAVKTAVQRLRSANLPDLDDVIARVYGSADFKLGVARFLAKDRTPAAWSGE